VVWYGVANQQAFGLIGATAAELIGELRQRDPGE
jgi:hypothetical protein